MSTDMTISLGVRQLCSEVVFGRRCRSLMRLDSPIGSDNARRLAILVDDEFSTERTNIFTPYTVAEQWKTVGDVVEYVKTTLAEQEQIKES